MIQYTTTIGFNVEQHEHQMVRREVARKYHPQGVREDAVEEILAHPDFERYHVLTAGFCRAALDSPGTVTEESVHRFVEEQEKVRSSIERDVESELGFRPNAAEYGAAQGVRYSIRTG